MALQLFDRVLVTATANTTVSFTLGSTVAGYQSFSVMTNGDTTYYGASDGTNWEVGLGTYASSGPTLTRTTILSSSNSGSAVTFSGSPNVWIDYPAGKSVYEDASNNVTLPGTLASTGITTPSVTATTTDLTLSAISTGNINLNTPNGTAFRVLPVGATSSNWLQVGNPSTTVIRLGPAGTTVADFRILAPTFTNFYTGSSADGLSDGSAQMRVSHTASAVNYVQVTGAATGGLPAISAQGSDSNIEMRYNGKGTSGHLFYNGSGYPHFRILGAASAVNYPTVTGSVTTNAVPFSVAGTDTNISMAFQPKGTGAIDLAAGSSGVNISNGGTVTAITRTTGGSGYTTAITATISAPTTAGGVQATVSIGTGAITQAIAGGGTGYTVGNILTVSGGTFINSAQQQIRVDTVSGGVITGISVSSFGQYTTLPTNPVSVTGGSGSGATFNLSNFSYINHLITNAGSGYIEQPTITFSGGGSGAAAYAIVGSGTIIRSLANTLDIHTPAGSGFQVNNASGSTLIYSKGVTGYGGFLASSITGNSAFYFGYVNNTEVGRISMTSSNNLSFGTSSSALEQFRVSHTASAVNYVQVTGAATGGAPTISAQGSDANVSITIASKNVADARLQSNGGNVALLTDSGLTALRAIPRVASGDTFLDVQRAVGFIDLIASSSVTDGDIRFTPKGAGNVRFGTYTGTILTPTGYITIKDSGGTTRRLLVG